jgi:hypothetical protein
VEHGHGVHAWSAAAAADLRGGAEAAVARRGSAAWRRAVRAAGEAARAATLLASGRSICVSRGRADHRRRTRPAERRTAASIMSVRDRVRGPGRAGRGVIEELGVRRRGARRVSPVKKKPRRMSPLCSSLCSSSSTSSGAVHRWRSSACVAEEEDESCDICEEVGMQRLSSSGR